MERHVINGQSEDKNELMVAGEQAEMDSEDERAIIEEKQQMQQSDLEALEQKKNAAISERDEAQ